MRPPRILTHIFDSESTTVTFGFMLFLVASIGCFIIHEGAAHALNADTWLWCVVLASILIGGKLVTKSILEAIELKLGGKPDLTEELPAKEAKPDGSTPAPAP